MVGGLRGIDILVCPAMVFDGQTRMSILLITDREWNNDG